VYRGKSKAKTPEEKAAQALADAETLKASAEFVENLKRNAGKTF
jgi:hypothetical protein